ncbi:MAG: zinc ribbon domain-containing protein [Thermoplasmata archaeon]
MSLEQKESDDRKRRIAATIAFFSEAVRFIVLPLLLLYIIMSNFPILTPEASFRRMATTLMMFGGLIAFSSSMEAYFPLGSRLKMIFGIISIATLCAWFWFLFSKENIVIPFGSLVITIDLFGLLLFILFALALRGLLPVGQYLTAKDEQRRKAARKPVPKHIVRGAAPAQRAVYIASIESSEELEPPPPDDFTIDCPSCGSKISPRDDICPFCGTWIRQKF